MVTLTDVNDRDVLISTEGIQVEEYPVNQTMITLADGRVLQVKETVEQVKRLLEQEKRK